MVIAVPRGVCVRVCVCLRAAMCVWSLQFLEEGVCVSVYLCVWSFQFLEMCVCVFMYVLVISVLGGMCVCLRDCVFVSV
jgi:hypothetical protein